MVWKSTSGFFVDGAWPFALGTIDGTDSEAGVQVLRAWQPSGGITTKQVWAQSDPDIQYLFELRAAGASKAVVCVTRYAKR